MSATGKYRIRKGLFGTSVLQQLYDTPSFAGGHVDASTRQLVWYDVPFSNAPAQLNSNEYSVNQQPKE